MKTKMTPGAGSEERFERAKKAWKEITGEDVSHLVCPTALRVDKAPANEEAERLLAWIALMRSVTFGSDVPKTINIMTKHALDGRAASESAYGLLRVYRARVSQSGSEHRPGSPAPSTGSSPAGSVDASGVAPYSDYPHADKTPKGDGQ